jgi:ribosomal protein S18 acetylase RimI-like enzyme
MTTPSPAPDSDLDPALGLTRISRADVARVAALLARAFAEDPLMRYAIPDASERHRLLPWLVGLNVRDGCRYGAVYVTAGFTGAAVWFPPGRTRRTPWRMVRSGMVAAPLRVHWSILRRLAIVEAHTQALHERYAPASEPHWYLAQLGVEPARQRQGSASRLLRPVLAHLDAQVLPLPCYLETEREANIAFYEHFGFRVVADDVNLPADLHIWALLRAARPVQVAGSAT